MPETTVRRAESEETAGVAGGHSGRLGRAPGFSVTVALLLGLLAFSVTAAVTIGPVPVPAIQVWKISLEQAVGLGIPPDWSAAQEQIVWQIRLPRVLLAAVVGAGLAVVGTTLQVLVRNPLADPFILGGSSGASVGAVLVIVVGFSAFGVYSLSVAAFLGALSAFALVFALAHQRGRASPVRLVLSGVAVSYALSGVASFLVFQAEDSNQVRSALFWMLGSLGGARWEYLAAPALALGLGTAALMAQARALNALLVGEETAATLGVDTGRLRRGLLVLTALLTGVMVAVSGGIGFVGLVMPHAVRLLVGADHRRVLPLAVILGAIFLVWVDVLARTALAPEELPIGVVTSLIGAPFFLWLLHRRPHAFGDGA